MKTFSDSGKVEAKFCLSHSGQKMELKHVSIPKQTRVKIASELRAGIPKNEVLERIRSLGENQNLSRETPISLKDLRNIALEYDIDNKEQRHENDFRRVDSFVKEMESGEDVLKMFCFMNLVKILCLD